MMDSICGYLRATAGLALGGLAASGAWALPHTPAQGLPTAQRWSASAPAHATPGTSVWARRYNGPGNGEDAAFSVAVSPSGKTVFVTGQSAGSHSDTDYATIAYRAATGARLWVQRYNGPGNAEDIASSITVNPTGTTVFVTGSSIGAGSGYDYATVAYRASTGARLWVRRYNGPGNDEDHALALAVSPGGNSVIVTGSSIGAGSGNDYATVAYRASTGARLWVKRYNGPANSDDSASAIAVSPAGRSVFVTGSSVQAGSATDYATVAYNTATGSRIWARRYNGPGNGEDDATSLAVGRSGRTVFVTGQSDGVHSQADYATIAYRAADGSRRWIRRYNAPGNGQDVPYSAAVSPSGRSLFVTGESVGESNTDADYATISYSTATGARRWVSRYNDHANGDDTARSVAVSPSGATVFVTGQSMAATSATDYATIAYRAATGARLWITRYNGPFDGPDGAYSLSVSPTGTAVFVTGFTEVSDGRYTTDDYATVAYRAR